MDLGLETEFPKQKLGFQGRAGVFDCNRRERVDDALEFVNKPAWDYLFSGQPHAATINPLDV